MTVCSGLTSSTSPSLTSNEFPHVVLTADWTEHRSERKNTTNKPLQGGVGAEENWRGKNVWGQRHRNQELIAPTVKISSSCYLPPQLLASLTSAPSLCWTTWKWQKPKAVHQNAPFPSIHTKCGGSPFCRMAALSKLSPGRRDPAEPRWTPCPCWPGRSKTKTTVKDSNPNWPFREDEEHLCGGRWSGRPKWQHWTHKRSSVSPSAHESRAHEQMKHPRG